MSVCSLGNICDKIDSASSDKSYQRLRILFSKVSISKLSIIGEALLALDFLEVQMVQYVSWKITFNCRGT